jgi:hypothetical protein
MHTRVEPLGKPYGIKVKCYLGVLLGTTWEPHVEHIGKHNGNNEKKKNKFPHFCYKKIVLMSIPTKHWTIGLDTFEFDKN